MNGSSDIRNEAKFESTANRESTPLWSERPGARLPLDQNTRALAYGFTRIHLLSAHSHPPKTRSAQCDLWMINKTSN